MSMHDPEYRKRATIALGLAIAIHEIAAGWVGAPLKEAQSTQVRIYPITITRATPTPKPTPKPTPRPTERPTAPPTPVVTPHPRTTVALVTATHKPSRRAAAAVAKTRGGAPSTKHVAAVHATQRTAIVAGHASGVAGSGSGTGAGAASGTGGLAGQGQGIGVQGDFAGLAAADVPCGFPTLIGLRAHLTGGKYYEDVSVEIQFRDGHVESGRIPYLFVYNSEADNPFSEQNKDKEAPLQSPPPGTDVSALPRAVQIAIKYTDAAGRTLLPECPNPPRG